MYIVIFEEVQLLRILDGIYAVVIVLVAEDIFVQKERFYRGLSASGASRKSDGDVVAEAIC